MDSSPFLLSLHCGINDKTNLKMNKKFPYGHDVNAYIDKAFERVKESYPWAEKKMLRKEWSYAIESVDGEYQYVTYFDWKDGQIAREVLDCDGERFIETIIGHHHDWIESENPVVETFDVPASCRCSGGWHLEIYRLQKHQLGGYSAFVQAGNRSAGGSRTFFIPPAYFKLSWEEFLDKYLELVSPGPFFVGRADLESAKGLKEFLGY